MLKYMQQSEKILLCVVLAMTLILCGVLALQRNGADENEKIYNVSVIVREASDSFSKGVDQAALDLNVDVHIISGYDKGDTAQQLEYMTREIDNGANALIVLPESDDFVIASEGGKTELVPVVSIGGRMGRAACTIGPDNFEAGRLLAGSAVERTDSDFFYIICPEKLNAEVAQRLSGLKEILNEKKLQYEVCCCREKGGVRTAIDGRDVGTLLVLDEKMLYPACTEAREGDMILGIGYDSSLRTWLETGRIAGLVVYSDYDIGYMSLNAAVESIRNGSAQDAGIELFVADMDNMYSDPVDKILFPIK